MTRNKNETYVSYLKRVIQAVRTKQISYDEMGDCLFGEENVYCHDNLRKMFYALDIIADKLDEDVVTTDTQLLAEIQQQKEELFKETVRLRDKNREIRSKLYKMARYENLEQVLIDKLNKEPVNAPQKEKFEAKPRNKIIEAALLISDIHYGIKIQNAVNCYDTDISYERMLELTDKVLKYCKLHNVNVLNIELLGDLISGYINVSNRVEQEEDLIEQIVDVSFILSDCINRLAIEIPIVNVYGVYGNHSRVNPNKKDNLNRENYERLIFKYIECQTKKVKSFVTSNREDYLTYKLLNGKEILCTHGDKGNKNTLSIDAHNILGHTPDEIHTGHWHSFEDKDDNLVEIVVNGSVSGTDDYALSIRKNTLPCQVLRIYDADTCTYKIRL